jgi:hypothetical protein
MPARSGRSSSSAALCSTSVAVVSGVGVHLHGARVFSASGVAVCLHRIEGIQDGCVPQELQGMPGRTAVSTNTLVASDKLLWWLGQS